MKHLCEIKMFSHLIHSCEWNVKTISCDSNMRTQREKIWHFPTVKEKWWPWLQGACAEGCDLVCIPGCIVLTLKWKIQQFQLSHLWSLHSVWVIDPVFWYGLLFSQKFWKLRRIQFMINLCLVLENVTES